MRSADIISRAQNYLEPKEILPKIERLYTLLPVVSVERITAGQLHDIENLGLSTTQLLGQIQASELQLKRALQDMFAIELNQKWKVIKEFDQIILELCKAVSDESLSINGVNAVEVTAIINSAEQVYPPWAIEHALFQISSEYDGSEYVLDPKKLAIRVGYLLLQKSSRMNLDEFTFLWESTVPDGVEIEVANLLNFAYFGDDKTKTINFLDPLSLPNEAIQLFERLFQIKKKWSEEELSALTNRVTPPGKKSSVIIQKYCRAVTAGGKKLYTSKTHNNNYR